YGGTGLGLAIASRLVNLMGGRIWVKSPWKDLRTGETKPGSAFHFTAAFGCAAAAADECRRSSDLLGIRTLVVARNPTTRNIAVEQLTNWGASAESASDPFEALEIIQRAAAVGKPVELLVAELALPGMSGVELVERIRRESGGGGPGVVLLTPARPHDQQRYRELKKASWVVKPASDPQLHRVAVAAIEQRRAPEPGSKAPRALERPGQLPLRILLAEDNLVNQKVARRLLEKLGHTVIVAADGEETLSILGREEVDLVLMDIQMPKMDGTEVTAVIRQREAAGRDRLPIVALTAHSMGEDRERCLNAGMDGYLSKPIGLAQLSAALNRSQAVLSR
ncbi:MAG: response regulator, partial [Pseudomonadota bacterium]